MVSNFHDRFSGLVLAELENRDLKSLVVLDLAESWTNVLAMARIASRTFDGCVEGIFVHVGLSKRACPKN